MSWDLGLNPYGITITVGDQNKSASLQLESAHIAKPVQCIVNHIVVS